MKKNIQIFLQTFLTVFISSYGAVFCVISAYGFKPETGMILTWIMILSAVFGVISLIKHERVFLFVLILMLAAAGWYLRMEIADGFMNIAERMMSDLISAYPAFRQYGFTVPAADVTAAFAAFSCAAGMIAYLALKSTAVLPFHIIFSALSAMVCLLETDKYPSALPLSMLTAGMIYPPLTFRERQEKGRASSLTAAFLAACVLVPYIFVQPSSYVRMEWTESFTDRLRNFSEEHAIFHHDAETGDVRVISPIRKDTAGSETWNRDLGSVVLSSLGPKSASEREEMQVSTDISGTIYLRGASWEIYEDSTWKHMPDDAWTLESFETGWTYGNPEHRMTLKMPGHISVMYIPYGLAEIHEAGWPVRDSYIRNTNALPQYTLYFMRTDTIPAGTASYREYVYENYLDVPEETRASLQQIADSLHSAADICEYVKNSAAYDLNTERMPAGRDFVSWFLLESDTGYCVHFATAAVILLRMNGIPARYVNGYMFNAEPDIWNSVQTRHAHAWVEYYAEGIGWKIMDPTPASAQNAAAEEEITETPEPVMDEPVYPAETAGPVYDDPQQKQADLSTLKAVLKVLLSMIAAAAAVLLMKYLRRLYVSYGAVNDRVRKTYRHMKRVSALLHIPLEEGVSDLALEAAFSDRTMTQSDLEAMQKMYISFCRKCEEKDLLRRILILIFKL